MPADAQLAIIAALIGGATAWLLTRSSDSARPGWAVRFYLFLFRVSDIPKLRAVALGRSQFPRREAFLATWFLIFFAAFSVGQFLWPAAQHP
jgi:hypothetical protein